VSGTVVRAKIDAALARADEPAAEAVFTLRFDEQVRAVADVLDGRGSPFSGASLAGLPVTVKDNFDIAGHATTAGSALLADAPPASRDAVVVERLRRAGCVLVGRTNMTEFAFSGLGLNPHYGTPLNPAFPGERRIPGGSSSGAAVSVALGIVPAAIGTDTGGSIRIPAALCGLTGFKPTAAAVSREGVLPLSETLDAVGVIATSVKTCAALFDAIRDQPGVGRTPIPARRIRLGLVRSYVLAGVSEEVEQAFARTVALLKAAGIGMEPIEISELDAIPRMMASATFPAVESAVWHASHLEAGRDGEYDPKVLVRIRAGMAMRAVDYVRLSAWRSDLIEAVETQSAGLDALIWPTVPFAAPTIDSLAEDGAYHAANALALRNSTVVNLCDGCAISLPCATDGAPVGMTLAASRGRDDHLLSIAESVQSIIHGAAHADS
jgi:aspartyl-tRNA(Asn)/glutamyl-tRNA(Gln) amidotransferase subunit A